MGASVTWPYIYTLDFRVLKTCLRSVFARAIAIGIIQQGMVITLGTYVI